MDDTLKLIIKRIWPKELNAVEKAIANLHELNKLNNAHFNCLTVDNIEISYHHEINRNTHK